MEIPIYLMTLHAFLGNNFFCSEMFYIEQFVFQFQFSSVQPLSCVWLFVTPWIAACQAPLSITNSQSLLKLMSIESVMPSIYLILCCPLLLLPPIPPSIRVFSNEPTLFISLLKEKSWVVLFPWEKVQTWQPKPFPQFH